MDCKKSGLIQKYEVTKISNPEKVVDGIVLEFDDPNAHESIWHWAKSMKAAGYDQLCWDIARKLSLRGFNCHKPEEKNLLVLFLETKANSVGDTFDDVEAAQITNDEQLPCIVADHDDHEYFAILNWDGEKATPLTKEQEQRYAELCDADIREEMTDGTDDISK